MLITPILLFIVESSGNALVCFAINLYCDRAYQRMSAPAQLVHLFSYSVSFASSIESHHLKLITSKSYIIIILCT